MEIKLDGPKGGFWLRNLLRAALVYLWFDHGRYLGSWGGDLPSSGQIELLIIISLIVVFVLEILSGSGSGENSENS